MLGRTANGIYWMFRYLERSENVARLIDAGLRIALTRASGSDEEEWRSVLLASGGDAAFVAQGRSPVAAQVVDWLLRDRANPGSVLAIVENARTNARSARASLTREVWEAVNECWLQLSEALRRPVREADLPATLALVRRESTLVRGALHGSMLRNDIYNFARIGTFIERADNTARILDIKYYVLLPSVGFVGSTLDNVQWDNILRSVSGQRSYRWLYGAEVSARGIADFLILDQRFPRSLAFCYNKLTDNLGYLLEDYGERLECHDAARDLRARLKRGSIEAIFEEGLHEFITGFLAANRDVGLRIERDYRFAG